MIARSGVDRETNWGMVSACEPGSVVVVGVEMEGDFMLTDVGVTKMLDGTCMCVSACKPGSETDGEEREIFWNNVDELQNFGTNFNVAVLGGLKC